MPDNSRLLKRLWLSVNSGETSHLYEETEEGVNLASAVMSSPILSGEGGGGGGGGGGFIPGEDGAAGGGGGALNEFGVDPSVDPDLYMALRLSLEDERARQQRVSYCIHFVLTAHPPLRISSSNKLEVFQQ